MTETAFMCRFVYDHSIVHVVAGVRDDRHDGIHPVREVVQSILVVQWWSYNRRLSRLPQKSVTASHAHDHISTHLQAIGLVIRSVPESSSWCSHRLLAHLALVPWQVSMISDPLRQHEAYILRGDWLKSENGVMLLTMLNM